MSVVRGLAAFVTLVGSIGVVLFLGGLSSAWLEVRRERRAGDVPTRPAWDNAAKRRALGGYGPRARHIVHRLRTPGLALCWCDRGALVHFEALDASHPAGTGCAAWEAGDAVAVARHDAAGGYARVAS